MNIKRKVGVHTSIAGGMHQGVLRAHSLGCTTLQMFSHNPRGWAIKSISNEVSLLFISFRQKYNISPVYIHTSYLINLVSRDQHLRNKSIQLLAVEMDRADALGVDYVVLHPGSAPGEGKDITLRRAIHALNTTVLMGQWKAGLLIENSAGERGDIASSLVDMAHIINGVKGSLIKGMCFDTCHAFAGGYDVGSDEGIQQISDEIERCIGLDKVKLIHLNDSKGALGSGVDRHEHIGCGKIGMKGLKRFITAPPFSMIPLILETPKKTEFDDSRNLRKVRDMMR